MTRINDIKENIRKLESELKVIKETEPTTERVKKLKEKEIKKTEAQIKEKKEELAQLENSTGNNATSEEKTQPKDGDDNQQGNEANTENGEQVNSELIKPYQVDFTNNNEQNNQEIQGEREAQENTQQTIDSVTTEEDGENSSFANNTSQEDAQTETSESLIAEGEVVGEEKKEENQANKGTQQKKDQRSVKFDDEEKNEDQVTIEEVDEQRDESKNSENKEAKTTNKDQIFSPSKSKISARRGAKTQKQRTILLIGLTGSGKSTLGNVLTEKENFDIGTKTKKVSQEKFSIIDKEEESTSIFQIIDTPDFFEENDSSPEELLKETLEILCKELNRLNQIFLVVSNEDVDEKDKIRKISTYYNWAASLFPTTDDLKKHFSIVITKFNEFEDETKCEEKRKKLLEKLNLGGEISFNIIFVGFFPHQETSEGTEKASNEIRKTLVENLKNCQELYTPNKKFKTNFCNFLQKKTKKMTKGKTQKFEWRGIETKTTILSVVIIGTFFLLYVLIRRWKEINDFNSKKRLEIEEI